MMISRFENEKFLLWSAVIIMLSFYIIMIAFRLAPPGGDTFLQMVYLFSGSNGVAQGEWVTKWMPKVYFGTTGLFAVAGNTPIIMHIFDTVLYIVMPEYANIPNFMYVYYAHMLFAELILLIGAWQLSRMLYSSALTAFYVTVTVVTTSLWLEQGAFGFAMFAPVPFVIYNFQKALETGKAKHLFFASLLALYSSINIVNYGAIIQLLIYTTYFAVYFWINRDKLRTYARIFKPTFFGVCSILLLLLCVAALLYTALHDIQSADLTISKRDPNGIVPLSIFNSIGKNTGVTKYLDLFRGVNTKQPDLALFRGLLVISLLPLAVRSLPRRGLPILVVTTIIFLFTFGGNVHVSSILWYVFPGMHYFRYIGFVAPTATFLFCFLSGFGFEAMLNGEHKRFFFTSSAAILFISLVFCSIASLTINPRPGYVTPEKVLFTAAIAISLLSLFYLRAFKGKNAGVLIAAIVLLHVADVYVYKFNIVVHRAQWQTEEEFSLWNSHRLNYQEQRTGGYFDTERGKVLKPQFVFNYPTVAYYSSISSLIDHEPALIDLFPLERQARTTEFFRLYPENAEGARASIAGISRPKLQFFSSAFLTDGEDVKKRIADKDYAGGALCLDRGSASTAELDPAAVSTDWAPTTEAHVAVGYRVAAYTPNRLSLALDAPLKQPTWLFYSDAWNPRWHAKAGGAALPVFAADHAFKAVLLPAGAADVTFSFDDKLLDAAALVNRLASLVVFGWVCTVVWSLLFSRKRHGGAA